VRKSNENNEVILFRIPSHGSPFASCVSFCAEAGEKGLTSFLSTGRVVFLFHFLSTGRVVFLFHFISFYRESGVSLHGVTSLPLVPARRRSSIKSRDRYSVAQAKTDGVKVI
jgi:hypothetical protein